MLKTLPITIRGIKGLFAALILVLILNDANAQMCGGNYPNPKGVRRPGPNPDGFGGFNIPGTNGFYKGLLEYLPTDYATETEKVYPLIIYFHGYTGQGNGATDQLCKIITEEQSALGYPVGSHLIDRIERGNWGSNVVPTVVDGPNTTSFIVIAPQYTGYGNGDDFNFPDETEALIDYLLTQYRVDESRIYMTGISTGSNMIMDYIASNPDRGKRIAAAAMPSLCLPRSYVAAQAPANIVASKIPLWFIHCIEEEKPPNPNTNEVCEMSDLNDWLNALNALSPDPALRVTILGQQPADTELYPDRYNWCQSWTHDAWRAAHAPDFSPTSGAGPNLYSWFLTFQRASALPIILKSFNARLSDGKVYLRWITTSEQDNANFTIERSGGNGAWTSIGTVPGGGTTNSERIYDYVDENPLTNLSFYRIKQTDINGKERYYDVRKVMNKSRFKNMVIVTPNPFTTDPSAFINVDKKQRVSIYLTDMSGRVLSTVNGTFEEGTTELSLPTNSLPRGVYFIKVAGENISETHKIIKQ